MSMTIEVAKVSESHMGYLSPSFHALWSNVPLEPNLLPEAAKVNTSRCQEFMDAVQKKLADDCHHEVMLAEPIVQLFEQITIEESFKIKEALKKKLGYFRRFFGSESWGEWIENRTALGKIVSLYVDFITSRTSLDVFLKQLDSATLIAGNEQALALLQQPVLKEPRKELVSQFDLWGSLRNILTAIDSKIVSLLPLPQQVSATSTVVPVDEKLFNFIEKTYDQLNANRKTYQLSTEDYKKELDAVYQSVIVPAMANRQLSARQTRQAKEYADAKVLLDLDKAEYDYQKEKFEQAKKDHLQKPANYIYEDTKRLPKLEPSAEWEVDENGQRVCVMKKKLVPGYFRWSIYKSEWGIDSCVDADGYNFDTSTGWPTTESSISNSCR